MNNAVAQTVSTLSNLIQVQNKRLEGYRKAQELTGERDYLRNIVSKGGTLSYSCRDQLMRAVMLFGGNTTAEENFYGPSAHAWEHVENALEAKRKKVILHAIETGEQETQRAYEYALHMHEVPVYIREILILQKEKLNEHYERVKKVSSEKPNRRRGRGPDQSITIQ